MNLSLFRTLFCLAAGIVFSASPPVRAQAPTAPRTPNIVLILANDLGCGDLGCYGQKKIKTPNLDQLAAEGMRFTQCYAGSCEDAPSRCVLMTGLHTGHATIRGGAPVPLRPEDVTVAQSLKQAGYKTGAFGKWGLGGEGTTATPNRKGFDEWAGFLDVQPAQDDYPPFIFRNENRFFLHANQNGQRGDEVNKLFTIAATNFVRIYHPTRYNGQTPFFIYLAWTIPHASTELARPTKGAAPLPNDAPYSNEPWPQPEKNKAAAITRLDTDVGKLLDVVKKFGPDEHTVIFFSSANGPGNEGGSDPKFFDSAGGRRGLYEGGIRVPMIVRWPGHVKAGAVSAEPWAFWDFLPTASELAGIKPSTNFDGISMLPMLLGQPQTNRHDFFYWENHAAAGVQQAARVGDWKALRLAPGAPLELYNLKTDPAEKENVAAKNTDAVARIEEILKKARSNDERWPLKAGDKRP
ncbi:MAG: arylsulfatase [Verrucomicrobia bacterium]|nr:arylsulfatase [Verrucomicrobiota bacterium]